MDKINLNCTVMKKCNGCQLNNLDYKSQLNYKQNQIRKYISPLCKANKIIGMEHPFSYRNKAQVVFKINSDKTYSAGIYKSTTKSIVPVNNCKLQTTEQNEIIKVLESLLKSFKIKPYDFYKKTGWLKSVVIRQGFTSKEIMVNLIGGNNIFPAKNTFISALLQKCPYITTIVASVNELDILNMGNVFSVLYGKGYITDKILEKEFIISSNSFFQINPLQTQILYQKAIELASITKNDIVLDAYCGVGTIGILTSDKAKSVYAVEINENAINDANKNKKINNINNIEFICSDIKEQLSLLKSVDIVFIDPPRFGCDKKVIELLTEEIKPKKIVYISCNIKTQARDIKIFKSKNYNPITCQPIDMFPHTSHIESIVFLKRCS